MADEQPPTFPLPDDFVDLYPCLLEMMDEGRLPIVSFIRPGLCYYRSLAVAEWSPVLTGDGATRQDLIIQVMRFCFEEGSRDDSGG